MQQTPGMRTPTALQASGETGITTPLFRKEAIAASATQRFGDVLGAGSLGWPTLLALLPCVALLLWLCLGSYTRTAGISGELVPRAGQISIATLQGGEVVRGPVTEGAPVHAGEVLFELRSTRASVAQGATEPAIAALLESRRQSLLHDRLLQQQRERERESAERARREARMAELQQLSGQRALQRDRVALAAETVDRYAVLHQSGFVAALQLRERQADLIDQRLRLAELERGEAAVRQSIESAEQARREQRWQAQRESEASRRELAALEEGVLDAEARKAWLVRAPRDGLVSGVVAVAGQTVAAGATLASLLPVPTDLEAELLAPSRAAGFLKAGQPVQLRYQAYPYQKFGLQYGRVREVSGTVLRADARSEPVYRVRVSLARQALRIDGRWQSLKPGQRVDASVLLERRRLYEWLLEPLHSLWGRR